MDAFPSTLWSLVRRADSSKQALGALIERYWPPVFWYIRATCGRDAATSADLAQSFFLSLMESDVLARATAERGRFRSYLKTCVRHFVADQGRADFSVRHGGRVVHVPIDQVERDAPELLRAAGEFGVDAVFEREWRAAVIRAAVDAVKRRFEGDGRAPYFDALRLYDVEGGHSYDDVARRLGVTEADVRNMLRIARQAFREALRAEVAQTVESPAELDDEMRTLFG